MALVEADQRGSAERAQMDSVFSSKTPPAALVPWFDSATPILTWNHSMAQTSGSGYDGTGVTVAVVDSGLPQNWPEFLPPGSVDLEHAVGFGAEGWGDFHGPINAIRGAGGHLGLFPHGLAVSSVIVGFPSEFGPIAGAAPGVKILPIRVLDQFNFGWFSWFTAGILHVARLTWRRFFGARHGRFRGTSPPRAKDSCAGRPPLLRRQRRNPRVSISAASRT